MTGIEEEFQAGILTNQELRDILSSDSISDADIYQVSKTLDDHHIKQEEPIEHARDALKSAASNIENNSDPIPQDKVRSLTPETMFSSAGAAVVGTHFAWRSLGLVAGGCHCQAN